MGGAQQSRILILGLDGAGKTSFLNRVKEPKKEIAAEPTESYTVNDVKFKSVKFNVWDVSGKSSVRSLWASYYKQGGIDAIIWVVDAADKDRLEEGKKVLQAQMRDPELTGKMLFVVANKSDVAGALSADEVEKALKLNQYEDKRAYKCVAVSAKTGEGVKDAMALLAKETKLEIKHEEKGLVSPRTNKGDDDKSTPKSPRGKPDSCALLLSTLSRVHSALDAVISYSLRSNV